MREHPSSRIDFRSDTVTQPTKAMREAMMNAPVGDDVLGDDMTVIELQERVAGTIRKFINSEETIHLFLQFSF